MLSLYGIYGSIVPIQIQSFVMKAIFYASFTPNRCVECSHVSEHLIPGHISTNSCSRLYVFSSIFNLIRRNILYARRANNIKLDLMEFVSASIPFACACGRMFLCVPWCERQNTHTRPAGACARKSVRVLSAACVRACCA